MLKDLGHSTYSFAQSLLDEDNYIDASGLVVLRHTVGEVNNSHISSFRHISLLETPRILGAMRGDDMLGTKCEVQCGA